MIVINGIYPSLNGEEQGFASVLIVLQTPGFRVLAAAPLFDRRLTQPQSGTVVVAKLFDTNLFALQ